MKPPGSRLEFESEARNGPHTPMRQTPRARLTTHTVCTRSEFKLDQRSDRGGSVVRNARSGKSHTCHESDREHAEDEHSLRAAQHSPGAPHENGGHNERGKTRSDRAEHDRDAQQPKAS